MKFFNMLKNIWPFSSGYTRPAGPKSMLFHLYNTYGRLKGTCAFERIGELDGKDGKHYFLYAVALTKVDRVDAPSALKTFGHEETMYRLDCVLNYYEEHRPAAVSVLENGEAVWMDRMHCILPFTSMVPSTDARLMIADAMKRSNPMQSFMPRFLKKCKTRRELL
jgi:hypothetical protein